MSMGVNRIIQGKAITHPVGDPVLDPERELQLRRLIVQRALSALTELVPGPTIFTP